MSSLRVASEAIGRQRAELAATLHPSTLAPEFVRRAKEGGWPHAAAVSAALEGRVTGAPLEAVLAAVGERATITVRAWAADELAAARLAAELRLRAHTSLRAHGAYR